MTKPKKSRAKTTTRSSTHRHSRVRYQQHRAKIMDSSSTSTGTKFRSIDYLPEHALEAICNSLSRSDISACARVSKTWSWVFTKALWKELHVNGRRPESDYKNRRFKEALVKNGHLIRTLKMDHYGTLESFFVDNRLAETSQTSSTGPRAGDSKGVVCTQLERLEMVDITEFNVMFHGFTIYDLPLRNVDENLLVRFLQKTSSTLHTLLLTPFPCNRANFLRVISDCLPVLKSVHLISTEPIMEALVKSDDFERFLEHFPPQVEELTLRVSIFDDAAPSHPPHATKHFPLKPEFFADYNTSAGTTTATSGTLAVKKLVLGGDMSCDPDMLNAFLRRCPDLECITLEDLCLETFRPLASVLRKNCSKLKELSIGAMTSPTDDLQLSLLIGASSAGWKRFTIHGVRRNFGPNSTIALRKHFKTLEWLELPKGACMPSQIIRDLLVGGHAPELRYLDLMNVIHGVFHFHTGLELNAVHLLVSPPTATPRRNVPLRALPWTCLNLVYLRIKIHNIPRTELLTPTLRRTSNMLFGVSLDYGTELQRVILGQIGRLVHLEELAFGNKEDQLPECLQYDSDGDAIFDERYPQCNSLSLTLEHGLHALAPLKKLRVLDITCVTHKIANRELSWMKLNWPKLERIDGLLNLVMIPPAESAVQWLKHNRLGWVPDQELKAWCKLYNL